MFWRSWFQMQQQWMLDVHFSHLLVVQIIMVVWKRPKINEKEAGLGTFKISASSRPKEHFIEVTSSHWCTFKELKINSTSSFLISEWFTENETIGLKFFQPIYIDFRFFQQLQLQLDSNSDSESRRRACWPLGCHQGLTIGLKLLPN